MSFLDDLLVSSVELPHAAAAAAGVDVTSGKIILIPPSLERHFSR